MKTRTFLLFALLLLLYGCAKDESSLPDIQSKGNVRLTAGTSENYNVATKGMGNGLGENNTAYLNCDILGELSVFVSDIHKSSSPLTEPLVAYSNTSYSGNKVDTDRDGKMDTERIEWTAGDQITIINWCGTDMSEDMATYYVDDIDNQNSEQPQKSSARLYPVSGSLLWGNDKNAAYHFYGIYPKQNQENVHIQEGLADFFITSGYTADKLTMPSEQYCTLKGSGIYAPDMQYATMFAGTYVLQEEGARDGVDLTFYPGFTAYEFSLYNPDPSKNIKINSAVLSSTSSTLAANRYSATTVTIYMNKQPLFYNINALSGSSKSVTVRFKQSSSSAAAPITLSSNPAKPTIFTILTMSSFAEQDPIPQTNLTLHLNLTVDGVSTTRELALKKGGAFISVQPNHKLCITNLSVTLPHPFSISSTQKILFSPGNLQAKLNGYGRASQWRFAEHQFDYVGTTGSNANISRGTGWMDLFGWSGSYSKNYGIKQTDGTINMGTIGNDFGGNFEDWGNNPTLISNLGSGWSTLSKYEWNYLLTTRLGAAQKKGFATIDGVKGLLLLPDDWVLPSGCQFTTSSTASYPSNRYYTTSDSGSGNWLKMERAGAVFLPFAGYSNLYNGVYTGENHYWTSTPNDWNWPLVAYYLDADTASIYEDISFDAASGGFLCTGFAVRLVKRL